MLHLEDYFPRKKLGFFPSPLHRLERLSTYLNVDIWAKREDVSSGLALGGNKIRKLEWLVADALQQSCDTLVSIGGVQSNHTRQVAAAAAVLGMKSYTVQESWAEWDDPMNNKVGNILLTKLMGGKIALEGKGYSTHKKETWEKALEEVRQRGGKPYAIPAGASDHPLGGLGYVHFAEELALQEKEMNLFFDTIVVSTCTGSTQAGMLIGFSVQPKKRRVIGIDAAHDAAMTYNAVKKIALSTAALLEGKIKKIIPFSENEIEINSNYSAPSYGVPSPETIRAIRTVAELEAMITDPVYEGKSIHGLIDLCQRKEIQKNSNVLYIHLGGTPALNAYHTLFHETDSIF